MLLHNIVSAPEAYLFEVAYEAEGIDRDFNMPDEFPMLGPANQTRSGKADMNFSTNPRGDEGTMGADGHGVNPQMWYKANMKPMADFDGQATVTPNRNGIFELNPEGRKIMFNKVTNQPVRLSVKPFGSIVFHTLGEMYYRTDPKHRMQFPAVHDFMKKLEQGLPAGHPAKSLDPGSMNTDYTPQK